MIVIQAKELIAHLLPRNFLSFLIAEVEEKNKCLSDDLSWLIFRPMEVFQGLSHSYSKLWFFKRVN